MKINSREIASLEFAYDGCHKIYLIESKDDKSEAIKFEYEILPIEELSNTWNDSCELRFINNWSLTDTFVEQFEDAVIRIR